MVEIATSAKRLLAMTAGVLGGGWSGGDDGSDEGVVVGHGGAVASGDFVAEHGGVGTSGGDVSLGEDGFVLLEGLVAGGVGGVVVGFGGLAVAGGGGEVVVVEGGGVALSQEEVAYDEVDGGVDEFASVQVHVFGAGLLFDEGDGVHELLAAFYEQFE